MIKNYFISGDTHGKVLDRLSQMPEGYFPSETALIILGDAGINYYLNKTDLKLKKAIQATGYTLYCVRGNHEERPENIPTMKIMYDEEVQGEVYYEEFFPNIKYFKDGGEYNINGLSVLTIGGAYSVDKKYRLARAMPGDTWTGWFEGEQLTEPERVAILQRVNGKHFDLVFTHTAPLEDEPVDLFLSFINQKEVDKTMEEFLSQVKNSITFGKWYFGHYHANRNISEKMIMLYGDIWAISIK